MVGVDTILSSPPAQADSKVISARAVMGGNEIFMIDNLIKIYCIFNEKKHRLFGKTAKLECVLHNPSILAGLEGFVAP